MNKTEKLTIIDPKSHVDNGNWT